MQETVAAVLWGTGLTSKTHCESLAAIAGGGHLEGHCGHQQALDCREILDNRLGLSEMSVSTTSQSLQFKIGRAEWELRAHCQERAVRSSGLRRHLVSTHMQHTRTCHTLVLVGHQWMRGAGVTANLPAEEHMPWLGIYSWGKPDWGKPFKGQAAAKHCLYIATHVNVRPMASQSPSPVQPGGGEPGSTSKHPCTSGGELTCG